MLLAAMLSAEMIHSQSAMLQSAPAGFQVRCSFTTCFTQLSSSRKSEGSNPIQLGVQLQGVGVCVSVFP